MSKSSNNNFWKLSRIWPQSSRSVYTGLLLRSSFSCKYSSSRFGSLVFCSILSVNWSRVSESSVRENVKRNLLQRAQIMQTKSPILGIRVLSISLFSVHHCFILPFTLSTTQRTLVIRPGMSTSSDECSLAPLNPDSSRSSTALLQRNLKSYALWNFFF